MEKSSLGHAGNCVMAHVILRGNLLTEIPDWLLETCPFVTVDLSDNKLTGGVNLTSTRYNNTLEAIRLRGNNITDVTIGSGMEKLKILDVDGNQLHSIGESRHCCLLGWVGCGF